MLRRKRGWLRTIARIASRVAFLVVALVVMLATVRGMSRQYFCVTMDEQRAEPCCPRAMHADADPPLAPSDAPPKLEAADCDCCKPMTAPAQGPSALPESPRTLGTSWIALAAADGAPLARRDLERIAFHHATPPITGPPPTSPSHARLMVFRL